jgi:hypothetical protein
VELLESRELLTTSGLIGGGLVGDPLPPKPVPPPVPPIVISENSLSLSVTQWDVNQPYTGTIANFGTTPATLIQASGLPAGLNATLSGSTITLSGMPTQTGPYAIGLETLVQNGTLKTYYQGSYNLTINPALALGSPSVTALTAGQAVSSVIAVSGGTPAYSNCSVTGLPPGLSPIWSANAVTLSGTPTQAGTFSNVVVSLRDATGVTVRQTYSLTVSLALSPGSLSPATDGQGYRVSVAATGGSGLYSFALAAGALPAGLSLSSAGVLSGTPTGAAGGYRFTVRATDTANTVVVGTQSYYLLVNPGAASRLVFATQPPATVAAGTAFQPVVEVMDAYGNGVPGVAVTLGGTTSPTSNGNSVGYATFYVVAPARPGTYTVSASAPGLAPVTSSAYTVVAGAAETLTVSPAMTAVVAGSSFNVSLTFQDLFGNTADFNGNVTLTSSDAQLTPVTVTASHGTASATIALDRVGSLTLSANASNGLLQGTSGSITVSPAAAASFVVTSAVTWTYAGRPFNVTLTARDAYGNTATGYNGSAALSASDGQAVSPSQVTLSNGTAAAAVTLNSPDPSVALIARAGALSGTSASFQVLPPAAITGLSTNQGYAPGYAPQYQQQGSSVTIYGVGFRPNSLVQFGNASPTQTIDGRLETAASYVDPSGTWLTVNVPRYAVNGPVYVVLPDGTTLTSPAGQTFIVHNYRDTYGFSFHNFTFNVTWGDVKGEWGGDQVDISASIPFVGTIDSGIPSPAGLAFWAASAIAFNGKGACFGMALASRLLATNPGGINAANGLPSGQAQTVYNLQKNDNLDNLIRQKHLAQWSAECAHEFLAWQASNALGNISAQSVQNQIASELSTGDNPIICLEGGAGHTVVAYGLEPGPNGGYYIDVYDPNRPFNGPSSTWSDLDSTESVDGLSHRTIEQASRILVDPTSQTWSFPMQGANGTSYATGGGWGSLEVYPVSSLTGSLTMPASLTGLTTVIFGTAAAQGSLAPSAGQAGARPGSAGDHVASPQPTPVDAVMTQGLKTLNMGGPQRRRWSVGGSGEPISFHLGDIDLDHRDASGARVAS